MFPLRDSTPSESFPMVTVLLILINLAVFILEIMAGPELLNQLVYVFGLVPAYLNEPGTLISYYPLLTSIFLHGGWMHLIGNMWILWLFGDNIEDHMGSGRFLLFYLVCGLAAGMAHYYINPQSSIPVVGASGAVAGVMGAYFLMFRHARILTFVPPFFLFTLPAWVYLGFWVLSQLYCGTADVIAANSCGSIAFWAHIGGFGAGMLLHRIFLIKEPHSLP
ncbi:MAG: rhomboid family intramembrane serine protease [Syntrophomonadaceae bacterium]|nr:rhomboid family intramembrane serine protease [Syntrophomonadaceae bacterium]